MNDHPNSRKLLASYPIGGLSEYVLAPDTNLVVLPESIDVNLASRFGYIGTSFAAQEGGHGPWQDLADQRSDGHVGLCRGGHRARAGVHQDPGYREE